MSNIFFPKTTFNSCFLSSEREKILFRKIVVGRKTLVSNSTGSIPIVHETHGRSACYIASKNTQFSETTTKGTKYKKGKQP